MVDSAGGVGKVVDKLIEQAVEKAPKADAQAKDAFDQAMKQDGGPQEGQLGDGANQVSDVAKMGTDEAAPIQVEAPAAQSPGDAVLNGLDKMRSHQAQLADDISKLPENPGPEEMMKVQSEVYQVTLEDTAAVNTSKAIENDIKQLEKPQ